MLVKGSREKTLYTDISC